MALQADRIVTVVVMNFNDMAVHVREQADTDVDDASDAKLQVYAGEAYLDIVDRVDEWPDKMVTWSLTSVADTAKYAFSGLSPATAGHVLNKIVSIEGPDRKLVYLAFQDYLRVTGDTVADTSAVNADYFSVDGAGNLFLYPTPSSSGVGYTITGYREAAAWPSGSSEPDLPRRFDYAIIHFMLHRYYKSQEDVELAQAEKVEFEEQVNRGIKATLQTSSVSIRPKTMGGERGFGMSYRDRMRRDTEG